MPRSSKRHHHHQQHPTPPAHPKKTKSAVPVTTLFFGILGLGIAYFAAGSDFMWMAVGAIAGAAIGYFFGHGIDRSVSKEK
ncbi:MAG: hypothetical protein JSU05_11670 [Bacteroidetes bacterium]|nr:hypothetical protein [Bacteroidota bacterium]